MLLEDTLEEVKSKNCLIELFGLGYVGFPFAIRLAMAGFKVKGVDINQERVQRLKTNSLMKSEEFLREEFFQVQQRGNFILSSSPANSEQSKIGIICVPTPVPDEKNNSNIYVKSAVEAFLNTAKAGDIIIIESSIEVGTTDEMKSIIESAGFKIGEDFGLSFCPERIDPLNTKWKLENTPRVIYCSDDTTFHIVQKIYQQVNAANLVRVKSAKIAEVVKSFENAFRLVNISLVNELAVLCDKLKIDVSDVLSAASTKPFGFMPFQSGAGAGGHCIPKDPRFLLRSAKKFGSEFSTIETALKINSLMPKYIVDSIDSTINELKLTKSVIVCGLSYKPDIEDMRDSPGFKIIQELKKRNYEVYSYDPYYKKELNEKYLVENHVKDLDFVKLDNLDDDSIKGTSCICIVQHHTKTKYRLTEIYEQEGIPFIYDCQNRLSENPKCKTVLKHLGG